MKYSLKIAIAGCSVFIALGQASAQSTTANTVNALHLVADHATASVADLDKESDWYEKTLGFQVVKTFEDPDFKARQLAIPGYRIDLVWRRGSTRGVRAAGDLQQGWLHVVFRTPDIDALYARFVAQHVKVAAFRDKAGTMTHFDLADPEGNEIGIGR